MLDSSAVPVGKISWTQRCLMIRIGVIHQGRLFRKGPRRCVLEEWIPLRFPSLRVIQSPITEGWSARNPGRQSKTARVHRRQKWPKPPVRQASDKTEYVEARIAQRWLWKKINQRWKKEGTKDAANGKVHLPALFADEVIEKDSGACSSGWVPQ